MKIIDTLKSKIIELSSLCVALCALFIAAHQADSTNYHSRLSVVPLMQVGFTSVEDKEVELYMENAGTGPAIITDIEVGGEKVDSLEPTVIAFQDLNSLDFSELNVSYLNISDRLVVQSGEKVEISSLLLKSEDKATEEIYRNFLSDVPLTVCFRSLYGDLFYVTNNQGFVTEKSCAYRDTIKIGDSRIRFKKPWEQVVEQSKIYGY